MNKEGSSDRPSESAEAQTSLSVQSTPPTPNNSQHPIGSRTTRVAVVADNNSNSVQIGADISSYDGPIPAAQELKLYHQLKPELVQWFMDRADKERDHRHEADRVQWEIAKQQSSGLLYRAKVGLWLGFIIALAGLVAAAYAAKVGHPIAAGVIGGIDLLGLVAAAGLNLRHPSKPSSPNTPSSNTSPPPNT